MHTAHGMVVPNLNLNLQAGISKQLSNNSHTVHLAGDR